MTEVAVITGGASGFGLALGGECAGRGWPSRCWTSTPTAPRRRRDHSPNLTASRRWVSAWTSGTQESSTAAAATIDEQFGRCDLAISNVGVQLFGGVDRLTDDEWRWVLDVNVVGSTRVARSFVPLLRPTRGHLAFTASSSVLDPASRLGAYQASKFAVWGLAETLRLELADDGISVSVLFPSGMMSRHLETSGAAQPDHLRRPVATDDDLAAMFASNPSMGATPHTLRMPPAGCSARSSTASRT